MNGQEIPFNVVLFLTFCIILPLMGIVAGLISWPSLGTMGRVGVIVLAALVLLASFFSPLILTL